jgi:hypothetical protein
LQDSCAPPSSIASVRTLTFSLQPLALILLAWLVLVEGGTEWWYRRHEQGLNDNVHWSVPPPDPQASFKAVEIPSGIRGQFGYDEGLEGRWQDASGGEWQLYYFRWLPSHSLRKRVVVQLAKVHGPEKCLPAAGMGLKSYLGIITVPVNGLQLALQQYVFSAEGRTLNVFYGIYEDATGPAELANRRKDCASRIAAALAGSRNFGQRFLEIAVAGYERPEDARAALTRELAKVVEVEQ